MRKSVGDQGAEIADLEIKTGLMLSLVCPIVVGASMIFAAGWEDMASAVPSSSGNAMVTLNLLPTISMELSSDDIILNLAPTNDGSVFSSASTSITVITSSSTGYTLTISDTDSSTNLVNSVTPENVIPSLPSSLTISSSAQTEFTNLAWGYYVTNTESGATTNTSVNNATFLPIPVASEPSVLKTTDSATGSSGDVTQVNFGVKVDTSIPSGSYADRLLFQATTNIPPITIEDAFAYAGAERYNTYYKMQDMNSDICGIVEVYDVPTQLIDMRDGKLYWVSKLKDEHCWMTQNLDFDLSASVALTSDDTDLTVYDSGGYTTANGYSYDSSTEKISWTPSRSTIAVTGSAFGWTNDNNTPYSVDTGNWYYTDTYRSSSTANYLTTANTDYFNSTPYDGNGEHGHVGNYYNWTAAIATNNSSSYSASTYAAPTNNPQNSICPAGWRLPIITNDSTSEFAKINDIYNGVTNNTAKIEQAPLYFVRAGRMYDGRFNYPGSEGTYWSSTVTDGGTAYSLAFSASRIVPASTGHRRYNGHSVRCVAR